MTSRTSTTRTHPRAGPAPLGEVTVDGLLNRDDFEDQTSIELPEGPFETIAGFIVSQLGQLPQVGDTGRIEASHECEVTELDGRRVSRVRGVTGETDSDALDREELSSEELNTTVTTK